MSRFGLTRINSGHYLDFDEEDGHVRQLRKGESGRWQFKLKNGPWVGSFPLLRDARPALYSSWLDRRLEESDR